MKIIKENWHLLIPIVALLSPAYMALMRFFLNSAGFKPANQELVITSILLSLITLAIHAIRYEN